MIEGAVRRRLHAVGPASKAFDPGVVPGVRVAGDGRRGEFRAVLVHTRAARAHGYHDQGGDPCADLGAGDAVGALEEVEDAIRADVPAAELPGGQPLDREVSRLAAVAAGEQDVLRAAGLALV